MRRINSYPLFFFTDTATTVIYTLSLHDALPISTASARKARAYCLLVCSVQNRPISVCAGVLTVLLIAPRDRKSTRLNSSHITISYAVFCLKKKKKQNNNHIHHLLSYVLNKH